MESLYNMRSPAVRRLMKEAQELHTPTEEYFAQPVEDNLFEWHFTVRGPADSEFESGIYHGRIILPPEYPMKPPSIILLTPNGRFETSKKICLSISGHHPESWQPSWSIRTALLALIGFMPSHGGGAIGSLDYTPDERKELAKQSSNWCCSVCGNISSLLKDRSQSPEAAATSSEARQLAAQISFKGEHIDGESTKKKTSPNDRLSENDNASQNSASLESTSVRQRLVNNTENVVYGTERNTNQQLSSSSDSTPWNLIIGLLGLAIAVLLLRRILFV